MVRLLRPFAILLLAALLPLVPAFAAPADTKVGDVRVTFSKTGTPIRAEAVVTGAPVGAPLPAGTACKVLEVKLPWIRVQVDGPPPREGWLRAYETVEPTALSGSPPPPHIEGVGAGTVTAREATAAGRQFSESTERDYRASRRDLAAAYAAVDQLEAETQRADPYETIAFIVDGNLGRRGRDYQRPPRLPPVPEESSEPFDLGSVVDLIDKVDDLPGPFGKILPKKRVPKDAKKIAKLVGLAAKSFRTLQKLEQGFNTTQEYYLGRAVAAQAIARYQLDPDPARQRYVRLVGDAVVRLSERVGANHGGYHFGVLASPEVNAVSGPGGYVLITRGAVDAARDEEELAGIIAHELAHVTLGHGAKMAQQSKAFQERRKAFADALQAGLADTEVPGRWVGFFGDTVGDMTGRAMGHDYGAAYEFEADTEGTYLLYDVLYRAAAIRDELLHLAQTGQAHGGRTHAPPQVRAQRLERVLASLALPPNMAELEVPRTQRFATTMGRTPPAPPAPPPSSGPPPPPPPLPLPK